MRCTTRRSRQVLGLYRKRSGTQLSKHPLNLGAGAFSIERLEVSRSGTKPLLFLRVREEFREGKAKCPRSDIEAHSGSAGVVQRRSAGNGAQFWYGRPSRRVIRD